MSAHGAAALAPWLQRQLQPLLAQRGHAWLLHGASGLGQYALALALVRAWLCEAAPHQSGPGQGALAPACGHCSSCHTIDVHTHPDLLVLMPEADMLELGWPLPEKAQKELDEKKRKPSREIRVDALREAVEFCQRTSAKGRGKAVLVYPAERMNQVSANTLLKSLEEPPGEVRFVLASESAQQLLPTIRSRCLGHSLPWPAPDEALAWLQEQGVPADAAPVLLRACGNRPDDALAWARSGRSASAWAQFPRAMAQGQLSAVTDWSGPELVQALQKLCHDLQALAVGADPRYFDAADLPRPIALSPLVRWGHELRESARSAEHPFNAGLQQESLVSGAQKALNSSK